MTTDASTPAFPATENTLSAGLTKREWYAGLAMQAAATNAKGADGFTFQERAAWAFMQADAMIAEGNK